MACIEKNLIRNNVFLNEVYQQKLWYSCTKNVYHQIILVLPEDSSLLPDAINHSLSLTSPIPE